MLYHKKKNLAQWKPRFPGVVKGEPILPQGNNSANLFMIISLPVNNSVREKGVNIHISSSTLYATS